MKKKKWYKSWKFWKWAIIGYIALAILSFIIVFISDVTGYTDKTEAEEAEKQVQIQAEKANRDAERASTKEEAEANVVKEKEPKTKPVEVKPLTKEEVLSKFEVDEEFIDGEFKFVGSRTETADFYSLADTDRYRNGSVIFKDGQIARVKLIPAENQDVNKLFEEFGITNEPRKLNGMASFFEVALIPKYWSQNIEWYPFELD